MDPFRKLPHKHLLHRGCHTQSYGNGYGESDTFMPGTHLEWTSCWKVVCESCKLTGNYEWPMRLRKRVSAFLHNRQYIRIKY